MADLEEAGSMLNDIHRNQIKSSPVAREPGEIERLFMELQTTVSRLDSSSSQIIEKTTPMAAMERSVPDMGDAQESRSPETHFGLQLLDLIRRIEGIVGRLDDHGYRLET